MIKKKICMLGAFGVDKSRLVRPFVQGLAGDSRLATVGVQIGQKDVEAGGRTVRLMLWDIEGDDRFAPLNLAYLRGAGGYLLVADSRRPATVEIAVQLQQKAAAEYGPLPFLLLLLDDGQADLDMIGLLESAGWAVARGHAGTGAGVEEAFAALAARLTGEVG